MNYDKAHKEKQEQEPKDPNDKLDSTQKQRKKEDIMSIQDDTARQAEIAKRNIKHYSNSGGYTNGTFRRKY